jgi:hypothetical protein
MYIITPLCYTSVERLTYFKQYIEHVNKLNNLGKIQFLFFVEPDSENMVEMIPNHWNKTIFRNYYRFKPALNHFVSLNYCFNTLKLDYVFLLEDDIICSPDLYNLSKYCLENDLLTDSLLCTLNKHELYNSRNTLYENVDPSVLLKLNGNKYVSCWGTGISKSFWEKYMFKQWRMDITFDASIDIQTECCGVISPLISRTNQIGKMGLNYFSDLWESHGFSKIKICTDQNDISYKYLNVYE